MNKKTLNATVEVKDGATILNFHWVNAYLEEVKKETKVIALSVAREWNEPIFGTDPQVRKSLPITNEKREVIGYQSPGWDVTLSLKSVAPEARELLENIARTYTY